MGSFLHGASFGCRLMYIQFTFSEEDARSRPAVHARCAGIGRVELWVFFVDDVKSVWAVASRPYLMRFGMYRDWRKSDSWL